MQIYSFYQESVEPRPITVEVHTRFQIPSFQILGLPSQEIQEARERIMAAFTASDFDFPKKRVIVNLAPSAVRKTGTGHDLPIALRVLESVLELEWPKHLYAWGELGLDGEIKAAGKMATLLELILKMSHPDPTIVLLSPWDADQLRFLVQWRKEHDLCVPDRLSILSLKWLKEIAEVFPPARRST